MDTGTSSTSLERLTGAGAAELLIAVLGPRGGQLRAWRVDQVDHQSGGPVTAAYHARVAWPDGERTEVLGASGDVEHASVWLLPHDPDLPGLAQTQDDALVDLLGRLGIEATGCRARLVAYRPRRRAVVEIRTGRVSLFVKVLPPGAAQALHDRHRLLRDAGVPVPRSLGYTESGLLVLDALPGAGLRTALRTGGRLPGARAVTALLDRLPPAVAELPHRTAWPLLCDRYAAMIGAALPAEHARARQLAGAVLQGLAGAGPGVVPTHGDLYEGQLTVAADGAIVGVLDVDTVGPGHRADDLACALAHCAFLSRIDTRYAAARALGDRWLRGFTTGAAALDPLDLRLRTAGVLLSLATGPHRVQRPDWPAATVETLDVIEGLVR